MENRGGGTANSVSFGASEKLSSQTLHHSPRIGSLASCLFRDVKTAGG